MSLATKKSRTERPKPFLFPQFCKACGRCIGACPKGCISLSGEIDPRTGLTPVTIDADVCNGCGLCLEACPEPFGLLPSPVPDFDPWSVDPNEVFGARGSTAPEPVAIPDRRVALPAVQPMVLKGNHAAAIGALLAGCRHFFGYPITPSTEGAELMARILPELDGVFVQAVSEVATVNMMYGCGGAGLRSMTFTSSPGFSLMLEGISYMIGAELPGVFVNVMRGGPGLGNIGPEQSDISLVCRGLGHGNTHAIVLAPSTPQEMVDLTMLAFELTLRYRNPVVIVSDGYLGQMTGKVELPLEMVVPGIPEWAVYGDRSHRKNVVTSIYIVEQDLELHNEHLERKYGRMIAAEQRSEAYQCDDAEWLVISTNTPGRMTKGAVRVLRDQGVPAGAFRPITLWPFPAEALARQLTGPESRVRGLVVVEAGPGQLEDEVRLALSHAGVAPPPIHSVRRLGGILPQLTDIVDTVTACHASRETSHV